MNQKLMAADETKKSINEKREQFRPVATRGSVLYFSVVELSLVNVMYQTSLDQFLEIFMGSMDRAEKASLASKRFAFMMLEFLCPKAYLCEEEALGRNGVLQEAVMEAVKGSLLGRLGGQSQHRPLAAVVA